MASNPATPFGIEFRNVQDLHGRAFLASAKVGTPGTSGPRSAFSRLGHAANETSESPFAALSARHGRPLRIAIISDFTRIPLRERCSVPDRFPVPKNCVGVVIGHSHRPHDPGPVRLSSPDTVNFPSLPLKTARKVLLFYVSPARLGKFTVSANLSPYWRPGRGGR